MPTVYNTANHARIMKKDRRSFGIESLERRMLLTQTAEALFKVSYDPTTPAGFGPIHRLGDNYAALQSPLGYIGVHTGDGQNLQLPGLPRHEVSDRNQAVYNGELYFFFHSRTLELPNRFSATVGQELWKTDSQRVELVMDISPKPSLSSTLFEFGDYLYFLADSESTTDDTSGFDEIVPGNFGVWRTDGTPEGTHSANSSHTGHARN